MGVHIFKGTVHPKMSYQILTAMSKRMIVFGAPEANTGAAGFSTVEFNGIPFVK